MTEQEKAFWEIWNKIESHFERYNHREMFDFGYQAAQQRMVKLLEDQECDCEVKECDGLAHADIQRLIGLFKGEQN